MSWEELAASDDFWNACRLITDFCSRTQLVSSIGSSSKWRHLRWSHQSAYAQWTKGCLLRESAFETCFFLHHSFATFLSLTFVASTKQTNFLSALRSANMRCTDCLQPLGHSQLQTLSQAQIYHLSYDWSDPPNFLYWLCLSERLDESICQKYEVLSLVCHALQLNFVLNALECRYDFGPFMNSDPTSIYSKAHAVRHLPRLNLFNDAFKPQLLRGHLDFHDAFKWLQSLQLH